MSDIRDYELQRGDQCAVPLQVLDLGALTMIYDGKLKPVRVDEVQVPRFKFLPFIKKTVRFAQFEFTSEEESK